MRTGFIRLLCGLYLWSVVYPVYAVQPLADNPVSETALLKQFPNARILHTTPQDYPRLAAHLSAQGYRALMDDGLLRVAQVEASEKTHIEDSETAGDCSKPENSGQATPTDNIDIDPQRVATPCTQKESDKQAEGVVSDSDRQDLPASSTEETDEEAQSKSDASLRLMLDISDDLLPSGSSSDGDEAVVVFIVIGAVVVVMWALYVFKYLYDVSTDVKSGVRWSDWVIRSSTISGDDDGHARFQGLRYATGFRDGNTDVGISAELGNTSIRLTDIGTLELDGLYWFIGPMLRWRLSTSRNPHYFQANFQAGSTEHDEMGVLAQAAIGMQFGLGRALNLGLSWGVLNINLKGNQGLISEREQYYYLYGLSLGYRF